MPSRPQVFDIHSAIFTDVYSRADKRRLTGRKLDLQLGGVFGLRKQENILGSRFSHFRFSQDDEFAHCALERPENAFLSKPGLLTTAFLGSSPQQHQQRGEAFKAHHNDSFFISRAELSEGGVKEINKL